MKKFFSITLIRLITLSWVLISSGNFAQEPAENLPVKLKLADKAAEYELQWLPTNVARKEYENTVVYPVSSHTEREIILVPPEGKRFFRLRSISDAKIPGMWGKIYDYAELADKLRNKPEPVKPVEKPAEQKLDLIVLPKETYLKGKLIRLPEVKDEITYYSLNDSPPQVYDKEVTFSQKGRYKLKIYRENQAKEKTYEKEYIFLVDVTPPVTERIIDKPFGYNQLGLIVGPGTVIYFNATDDDSGVKTSYFRIGPVGNTADYIAVKEKAEIKNYTFQSCSLCLLEYYSEDEAGNREANKYEIIQVK